MTMFAVDCAFTMHVDTNTQDGLNTLLKTCTYQDNVEVPQLLKLATYSNPLFFRRSTYINTYSIVQHVSLIIPHKVERPIR